MLLYEAFTSSNDLEGYLTHFELLAELQKWKRTEGDPAREVDERPHYFALRLQKSAIEFYRTLPQATSEKKMMNALKLFGEHCRVKTGRFPGTASSQRTATRRKTDRFSGRFKAVALKAYPTESQDIRDHLVMSGFPEIINHSQVRLDLRKQIGDKDMKIETVLERSCNKNRRGRANTKVAVIRRDETKDLVEAVTRLVNQLSVDDKQRMTNQSRERSSSLGRWGDDKRERGQQQDRGFNDRRQLPTPGSSLRDRSFRGDEPSRRNDRWGSMCRACGQERHISRYCRN